MSDEEIRDIAVSVWFPVGRANFYSYTANGVMLDEGNIARSPFMNDAHSPSHEELYLPRLQVSVMRRVIEVLPRSFGYRDTAHYVAGKSGTSGRRRRRPTRVTLTLDLDPAWNGVVPAIGHQRRANQPLVDAGLRTVTFSVDEDGFYVVRAPATADNAEAIRADPERVQAALETHLAELFGGDFLIQWQLGLTPEELREAAEAGQPAADHARVPAAAATETAATEIRLPAGYDAPTKVYNDAEGKRPRGIFTFFQLNTLFEGLFNDALTPAVFFQQRDKTRRYAAEDFSSSPRSGPLPPDQGRRPDPGPELDPKPRRVPLTVADIVHLLVTRLDATEDRNNKVVTLRHFLAVTSRESLQKLKWSVESVRRGLLDEMMSVLHRQSKLIQVKLEPLGHHEWAPEVATGANESQLRGYVMLVGAKLPLVVNVHRYAKATMHYLLEAGAPGPAALGAGANPPEQSPVRTEHQRNADDLVYRVKEWRGLVNALQESVRGLEKAVEHAWMERLLYEQEQARAEQEAMAEIQRVRSARPVADGVIGGQSAVMLFVTILAAVAAVAAVQPGSAADWWPPTWTKLQTWLGAGAFVLAPLTVVLIGQLIRRLRPGRVGYEFAFRLELNVLTSEVFKDLSAPAVEKGRRAGGRQPGQPAPYRFPDQVYRALRRVRLDRRGGARIEYASRDSTLVKVHHGVSFRVGRVGWFGRRAHFEIINEFLARDVSERDEYYLRETRVFGEAPRALTPAETFGLLVFVLNRTALCYQNPIGDQLRAEDVLRKAGMLFFTLNPAPQQSPAGDRRSPAPRQRRAGATGPAPALES